MVSKVVPTVLTGGLNLIPGVKNVVKPITKLAEKATPLLFPTTPKQLLQTGLAVATKNPLALLPAMPANSGGPMALDVGGILKQASGIFGGGQNQIFETISGAAGLASQFFPPRTVQTSVPMVAQPVMAMAPAIRAGAMVARGFFNRFPNLATAIAQLRNRGLNVKRSQLWSMLKRFGPEVLITGGLLTAAAVNELMVAGPGHRRMNPANVKALRRSMRRLDSFHRLCVTADRLRGPRRRSSKKCPTGSAHFVRQG